MPIATSTNATARQDLESPITSFMQTQSDFVADSVLPVFGVQKKQGRAARLPIEALLQDIDTRRSARAGYTRSDYEVEGETYSCVEYGFESLIDDSEREEFRDSLDADLVAAQRATHVMLQAREVRVATKLFNTTLFPLAGTTGIDTSVTWATRATADPIGDIMTGINTLQKKTGRVPDTLVINPKNYLDLSLADQIIERFTSSTGTQTQQGFVGTDVLARLLGVQRVIVASGVKNAADKGITTNPTYIWSDSYALLCYTSGGNDLQAPAIGRTFAWENDGGVLTIEQYRDETVRGDVFRIRQHLDEKVFYGNGTNPFGYLLKVD